MKYFSVRKTLRIAGKTYQPCICYELTKFLTPTIELLERNEKAKIYDEPVGFMNGKILEKKAKKPAVKKAEEPKKVEEPKKAKKSEAPKEEPKEESEELKDF